MLTISALSSEYVRVSVAAAVNGTDIDPTGDTVQMAFVPQGAVPAVSDWKTASWETDATVQPPIHYVRAVVGPTGIITLTPGVFDTYVKVVDNPELPVKNAGQMRVV